MNLVSSSLCFRWSFGHEHRSCSPCFLTNLFDWCAQSLIDFSDSKHSPNVNVVPNAYLNQKIEFEDMKKVGGTYESDKKETSHALIFTLRMEKGMDETQVT